MRARDGGGELPQRLRHQACLQSHLRLAHLAFELRARHQGRNRVDDQHIDGAAAHQGLGDFQGLLAVVRLGDEQLFGLDAEAAGVADIEGVLGIDEGADAAGFLCLRDHLQGQRRLARRLGAVDLDHAPARESAHAQGQVEAERSGGDHGDVAHVRLLAEFHDGALAELLLDLADGQVERPHAVGIHCRHCVPPLFRLSGIVQSGVYTAPSGRSVLR